jgi:LPS export ABC transporter permease LptG/LPS export ABC transporter permease LptF
MRPNTQSFYIYSHPQVCASLAGMRKIDKLLFRAIVPPFLIALSVLTFIVFLHEAAAREGPFNLSELLISRNASPWTILIITGGLLPGILIFTLPLSYLIGILIGLGGLSGESQITALRACGVPIRILLRFILLMGAMVGCITAILSAVVIPQTNELIAKVKGGISLAHAAGRVQPRVFNEDFPNYVFYVDNISSDRKNWSGIFLVDNSDSKSAQTVIARSGSWIVDSSNKRLQLHLESGANYSIDSIDPSKDTVISFEKTDKPISLNANQNASGEQERRPKKISERSTSYLWRNYSKVAPAEKVAYLVELNFRIALPFSIIPFALIGLTLGVNAKKGGRTSGFALSLAVVILFYILFLNGIRLALVGEINPWLGAWGANILLSAIGLILLLKVDKYLLAGNRLNDFLWRHKLVLPKFPVENARFQISRVNRSFSSGVTRLRFPKILDFYIARGFFIYFFWSLISCGTLFVLFTLFDLLDDIIRNNVPIRYVLDYFAFLTPQILMWVVPMSVLLAILINFGILEKNSEITAIKSGGWSLYRIAIPIFLIASGACAGLFVLQDYILPYANVRQDNIRNEIKGRPPQTSAGFQRKWIFGDFNRIYNYEYFDWRRDSFIDLNIYEIDLNAISIARRIHAAKARIEISGAWVLEDGYVRDYRSKQNGFIRIKSTQFAFPEKEAYFKTEIFQPKESAKRTYSQLNNYINNLRKSGYNATELKVELNKKISFPFSCFVMALLAVPFSFSTGKKGAFFGIGMSVAIAMVYWGISGLFEAMGDYGFLLPALAAWSPNILFGAAGLVLLFTIRT